VEQPPTHYQLSFTARQGLLLFVGFLLALGLAYFFGLMTGLSGRPPETGAVAEASPPVPASGAASIPPAAPATPRESRGEARKARSEEAPRAASTAPTAPAELQLFDDAGEPTPDPSRRVLATAATPAPALASAGGEFWVQVLSVSSEREAKARSARLAAHHYRAAVVPASTGRGKVYRVRVGPYRSREEADRAAALLRSRENVEPWIVPAGQ
jgi:DedD protein